jgi:hypothetical protein
MVRGCCGGRQWGARGGGVTPPVTSMLEGSKPQGDKQVIGKVQIVVSDMVVLMRSFQWMFEPLINRLDRDEARESTPPKSPLRALVSTGSIHRELEKVKFLELFYA